MRFTPIPGVPLMRVVPFTSVHQEEETVWVQYDAQDGTPVCLCFKPFQAIRVTTGDCCLFPQGFMPFTVVEVQDSPWIRELTEALSVRDASAVFMDRAHHYLIPGSDNFVEIVAWGIRLEPNEPEQSCP